MNENTAENSVTGAPEESKPAEAAGIQYPPTFSGAQKRALEALLAGQSIAGAARMSGLNRGTISRWVNEGGEFLRLLRQEQVKMLNKTRREARLLAEEAASVLARAIRSGDTRSAMAVLKALGVFENEEPPEEPPEQPVARPMEPGPTPGAPEDQGGNPQQESGRIPDGEMAPAGPTAPAGEKVPPSETVPAEEPASQRANTESASGTDLSAEQHMALSRLVIGHDLQQAASAAGVNRGTVRRWMKEDPAFGGVLRDARHAARESARAMLISLVPAALEVVRWEVEADEVPISRNLLRSMKMLERVEESVE